MMKPGYAMFAIVFFGVLLIVFFRHMLFQGQHKIVIIQRNSCGCASTDSTSSTTDAATKTMHKAGTDRVPAGKPVLLSTFLLIVVPMRPDSFTVRELIRKTWFSGYENSSNVLLRFLVGTKNLPAKVMKLLKREQSHHSDLAFVSDLEESYKALTNKTMAMMKWSHEHVDFSYLMKCDDDTFVYIDYLVRELRERPRATSLYYGRIEHNSPVLRDPKYVWYDPDWDLADTYLPYAVGGGYILSWDLVGMLARQTSHLKWHPNEDTAVGSWLAAYDYELRSDHLLCVTDVSGRPKSKCFYPPLFHIFYIYPENKTRTSYFRYLHKEHLFNRRMTAPTFTRLTSQSG